MGMDRLDCTHKKMDAQSFTQHGKPWHTMMQWWGHPKLEVSIRTFFSHLSESAEFACAAHFTLMNLENVLSQGGSNALPATLSKDWEDHQGESSVGIERLHVFLSFLHMYLFVYSITYCICYCYILYLLLSLFFQKYIYHYLSIFDYYVFLICFFFDWLGETSITRTRKLWSVPRKEKMLGYRAALGSILTSPHPVPKILAAHPFYHGYNVVKTMS